MVQILLKKEYKASLKKRTKSDMIISFFVAAFMGVVAFSQVKSYFMGGKDILNLYNGMYGVILCGVCIILGLILREVQLNGKPFTKKITKMLRIIAMIVMIGGFVPAVVSPFVNSDGTTVSFHFDVINFAFSALGVMIGIISEMFVYGYELQDDNDSIA